MVAAFSGIGEEIVVTRTFRMDFFKIYLVDTIPAWEAPNENC